MSPYIFITEWWDCDGEKSEKRTDYGLVFAQNLTDATHHIADYFGEESIAKMTITPIGDGVNNILDLTQEQAEYFEKEFA